MFGQVVELVVLIMFKLRLADKYGWNSLSDNDDDAKNFHDQRWPYTAIVPAAHQLTVALGSPTGLFDEVISPIDD